MAEEKERMRKLMMDKLANLDEEKRKEISNQLAQNLFASKLWEKAESIGIYLSFKTEWDTRVIIEEAWKSGKKVAIPKTIPETKGMDFYEISDFSQAKKGHFGIEEPIIEETTRMEKDEIDLLIVPGLIFSRYGYRIGFGGGYYDRFLVDFIHPTVSLVWSEQLVDLLPLGKYDLPVHYLITENEIIQ